MSTNSCTMVWTQYFGSYSSWIKQKVICPHLGQVETIQTSLAITPAKDSSTDTLKSERNKRSFPKHTRVVLVFLPWTQMKNKPCIHETSTADLGNTSILQGTAISFYITVLSRHKNFSKPPSN